MPWLLALAAFVLMEPVTYLVHRFVMHGFGRAWHDSHHRPSTGRFERNDLYPVVFAAVVVIALAAAYQLPGLAFVVPVAFGVTAYGVVYALVHDVYIHGRLPVFRRRHRALDRLAEAHRIHHLYQGEPYGMLVPLVPRALRDRAARTGRDPLARPGHEALAQPSR